jgi:geranylgeranyl diphosphate synthase type II
MAWIEEYQWDINAAIDHFFQEHYHENVTPNEKIFQEAVLYAVQFALPTRIHPILSMVVYEEILGLTAANSVISVLIGIEFIHIGLSLHTDAVGITDHYWDQEMPLIKKYGESMTILVGDALIQLGTDCLSHSGKISIIQEVMQAIGDVWAIRGYSRDILSDHSVITEAEYIAMYDEEISRLVSASLIIGAMFAGDVQQSTIDQLRQFWTFLARLYQVRLDVAEYERWRNSPDASFSRERWVVDFLGYEKATGLVATLQFELMKMTANFQNPKFKDIVDFFANQKM